MISNERKRILHYGDVFAGLEGIKHKNKKEYLMTKRHNDWMDMKPILKGNPQDWVKKYSEKRDNKDVIRHLEQIIKDLQTSDTNSDLYTKTKHSEYNLQFYKHALNIMRKLNV